MPEILVLRLNPSFNQHHSWMVVDNAGTRIGSAAFGALHEIGNAAEQRQLYVLLPANDCFVSFSELPLKNKQKLMQALPYSFEDQIIGESDELHFAVGDRNANGSFFVSAIRKDRLTRILDELQRHNLQPTRVIPEDVAIPITENGCSVLLENDEAIIRASTGDAVSLYMDSMDSILHGLKLAHQTRGELSTEEPKEELRGQDSDDTEQNPAEPMKITVYIDDNSREQGERAVNEIHEAYPHAEFRRLPHGALSKLAVESLRDNQPNLLQGSFGPRRSYHKLFEPWRYAATAAALLLALSVGYKALELNTMKQRLQAANSAMLQLAKETYPNQKQIPSPVGLFRSMSRGSSAGADGSAFIEHLSTISKAHAEGLDVRRLNYRAGNLDLEIVAPNVQSLDTFTSKVAESAQWQADLISTKADGNAVQGRINIARTGQ